MTAAELNPELRKLIDLRLDAIDRILARGEVTWSERRSIVGEVETQIFELLARRGESPNEEDLRAVLDSLDPPESYLPEELRDQPSSAPVEPSQASWSQLPSRAARRMRETCRVAACVAGVVIVNWIVIAIIAVSEGVIPWLVTLGGLAWLNYAALRRFRSWSATSQGSLLGDLRQSLAVWLMPKNGATAT